MTLHTQLQSFVKQYGENTLLSPSLTAMMDDEHLFREPDNRPYKQIFRLLTVNGDNRQIVLQWDKTTPAVSSFAPSYPSVDSKELRYAIECFGYALGKIDDVTVDVEADSQITQHLSIEDDTVEYISHGSSNNIGTMIPTVMAQSVHRHLNRIALDEGGVAEYVMKEMGEADVASIQAKLSGEQIDGVALAMRQMTDGHAFILGDMTGIGKGRQLAMLLKWVCRQGYTPVFVTEKSVLFNDLYRDLFDIGYGNLRPFILNSDKEARVTDPVGHIVYNLPTPDEISDFKATGSLPVGYDFLLMTYSQVNKSSLKSWKPGAVMSVVKDSYLFLDESHNASGIDSNVGGFFRDAVEAARGVCFASATYAKYPSSMPIYALKTAMGDANIPAQDLLDIVAHGGPILQEEMSRGLVESGSMIRRQRDMSDVERVLDTPSSPADIEAIHSRYDRIINIIDDIREFHDRYLKPYYNSIDRLEVLNGSHKTVKGESWDEKTLRLKEWSPQQRLAPVIRQLLFSLKTEQAIDKTLGELKEGRKPIVQISRTMSSNISRLMKPGDVCDTPDFALILKSCLEDIFQYEVFGETEIKLPRKAVRHSHSVACRYTLNDVIDFYNTPTGKMVTPGATTAAADVQECYEMLMKNISTIVNRLPLSPIDYFVQRLSAEGVKVGELTQRNVCLVYDDVMAGVNSRATCRLRKIHDKKQMAADFNSGKIDVLIGNRVMASGISLHCSEGFADTRPRTIITWEQQDSADIQTQFDGRADRTGQLARCRYVVLMSPVPAERRYLMINSRKQRSLNANVEANQGRDKICGDIFNRYGAKVIDEFSGDNPEYNDIVMASYLKQPREDKNKRLRSESFCAQFVSDFMRNIGLLLCKDQEKILSEVMSRYSDLMNTLDESNDNDLYASVLPLCAELTKREVFAKGKSGATSTFGSDANLDKLEVNMLRKPLKSGEIVEMMSTLKDSGELLASVDKARAERIDNLKAYYSELRDRALLQLAQLRSIGKYTPSRIKALDERANNFEQLNREIESVNSHFDSFKELLNKFHKGQSYTIPSTIIADGMTDDPILASKLPVGIFMGYKVNGGKYTRSCIQALFAVNDGRSVVRITLTDQSSLETILNQSFYGVCLNVLRGVNLKTWDGLISSTTRESAYMVTGNILAGIARCKECERMVKASKNKRIIMAMTHGKMVRYTDINGNVCSGYLLPRSFSPKQLFSNI